MPDYRLTVSGLADALGVSRQSVNELVRERRAVSPEMALRLGRLFGNSPAFWLKPAACCRSLRRGGRDPGTTCSTSRPCASLEGARIGSRRIDARQFTRRALPTGRLEASASGGTIRPWTRPLSTCPQSSDRPSSGQLDDGASRRRKLSGTRSAARSALSGRGPMAACSQAVRRSPARPTTTCPGLASGDRRYERAPCVLRYGRAGSCGGHDRRGHRDRASGCLAIRRSRARLPGRVAARRLGRAGRTARNWPGVPGISPPSAPRTWHRHGRSSSATPTRRSGSPTRRSSSLPRATRREPS